MQKNYYFIYFYAQKKASQLELKKGVPAIEQCTVIDKHPFEWIVDNIGNSVIVLKHYQRISREEYDYFMNKLQKQKEKPAEEPPKVIS